VHFIDTIEQDIYQLQDNELKVKTKYVNEKKYLDDNGCAFELIDGYSDSNGDLIRVVFRNNGSKYLCVWNDIGDTIEERVYKFG
jgi:hypothetical protein